MVIALSRCLHVTIVSIVLLVAASKVNYMRRLLDLDALPVFGSADSPRLAWLMTFPKGGGSYVQSVIHETTSTTTSNNYGWTILNGETVNSRLIWADRTHGPYRQNEKSIPSFPSYIATSTHCSGWCFDCPPAKYWKPKSTFHRDCLVSSRPDQVTQEIVQYDGKMVTKAIHLIRDPFSNIVSRFLMFEERSKDKDFDSANPITKTGYPMTKLGFQKYCRDMDTKFYNDEYEWFLKQPEMNEAMSGVPCRSEFYKYFQWHNLARNAAVEIQKVPYILIHCNLFIDKFETELRKMLSFLQLPENGRNVRNRYYNVYYYFYDIDQVNAVQKLAKYMSEEWLYNELDIYFIDAKDPLKRDEFKDEFIMARDKNEGA